MYHWHVYQSHLPVLILFAITTIRKTFNGCKCVAWASFTGEWELVGHVGQIVVLSNGTQVTVHFCWIVKFACGATDNFSFSGTSGEISVGDCTCPIIAAPDTVEWIGTKKHASHVGNFGHVPRWHVLIERICFIKHCKRGCNKEKKDQPTTNNKKGTVSNTQKQNNKTCENCDPMKLELSYIQNTQQRKAWPQRGRESTLTVLHICHRPRIPFRHVLIERRCGLKHCKRGCNKEKKDQPTTNHKKGTVSKTQK